MECENVQLLVRYCVVQSTFNNPHADLAASRLDTLDRKYSRMFSEPCGRVALADWSFFYSVEKA
jgi:hypothetical protein